MIDVLDHALTSRASKHGNERLVQECRPDPMPDSYMGMPSAFVTTTCQYSPVASMQDTPFGAVMMIVQLPFSDLRTSTTVPLLARPMALGFSA